MSVKIASITFDAKQRILEKDGQTRSLEPKVYKLLTTLLAANGDIVTRDQLIVQVWDNRVVGEGAINRTVSLLRGHFSALSDESIIETVPTQGYRFLVVVNVEPSSSSKLLSPSEITPLEKLTQQKKSTNQKRFKALLLGNLSLSKRVSSKSWRAVLAILMFAVVILLARFLMVENSGESGQHATSTNSNTLNTSNTVQLPLISNPLIGLKGLEYQLSTTASGNKILFHHLSETQQQSVYLYDTKTHAKQLILNDAKAVISSDGQQIVYSTMIGNQCLIRLYHVDTETHQTLIECNEAPTALAWGNNGNFYFNKRESKSHPYQVFSYNVKTSQLRQITNPNSTNNTKGDVRFAFNHVTEQLAVIRYLSENKSMVIISSENTKPQEYTLDLRLNHLLWHPENKSLILADKNSLHLFTVVEITSETKTKTKTEGDAISELKFKVKPQLIKQLEYNINSLAVLPSTSTKTNATETSYSLLISSANVMSEIVKYDVTNQQNSTWLQSGRTELLPRMQADTQIVLSTRYKDHYWWQVNKTGATLIDVKLPFTLDFVRYELSPDGKRILFTKHGAIYELDIDKKSYQKVLSDSHNSYVANYLINDKGSNENIIYSSNQNGEWQLWSYSRSLKEHMQLTQRGGYSGRVVGEYLYYSKYTVDGLWRKKLSEDNEEQVIKEFNRINWLNWQVIDNNIYFYRADSGIWQYNIHSNEEQLIMKKPDDFVHQYTISEDQTTILWVRLKSFEGDIFQYRLTN